MRWSLSPSAATAGRLRERVDKLLPNGVEDPAWDDLLKVKLYGYQKKGALFVALAGRSLLADDMGLGKTIQSLAAAELLAQAVGIERVLIVTPTSLKHQWKREIENFTHRSAMVVEGGPKSRSAAYSADTFFKIANYRNPSSGPGSAQRLGTGSGHPWMRPSESKTGKPARHRP